MIKYPILVEGGNSDGFLTGYDRDLGYCCCWVDIKSRKDSEDFESERGTAKACYADVYCSLHWCHRGTAWRGPGLYEGINNFCSANG
jgi:hypothetical protein